MTLHNVLKYHIILEQSELWVEVEKECSSESDSLTW